VPETLAEKSLPNKLRSFALKGPTEMREGSR